MNRSESSVSSAGAHAHQLAKMRSSPNIQSPPVTPHTPQAPETPSFLPLTHFGDEHVMEDLQLAAELGKTLLERNRELESSLKQQQTVIDDQLQEIEYLSKQTAALREVNDSRLRIYEQLEVSIQDLEKSNQRLSAEATADKKKIKSLSSTIDSLEARCEDLQKNLEETRAQLNHESQQQQQRAGNKHGSHLHDKQNITSPKTPHGSGLEDYEMRARLEDLQEKLKNTQEKLVSEARKREELEIELACISQEKLVLCDQLAVLQAKESNERTFDDELASLEDVSSGRICRKCLGNVDEMGSNSGLYDLNDSIEDTDASIESIHGECALIRMKNGGYAWGSQESLASIGQVVSYAASEGTSPGTEASDAPHNSLLSELDTSYRILIEKYEALLEAREQQQQQQASNASHPGAEDIQELRSNMTTGLTTQNTTMTTSKCPTCNTCACNIESGINPKVSSQEESSEVETFSSGFSDGESLITKSTQTEEDFLASQAEVLEELTPTVHSKYLDLTSPINPCDRRFQATPEYKKLFQEIFTVLKKTVDENDTQNQPSSKPCSTSLKLDSVPEVTQPAPAPVAVRDEDNDVMGTEQAVMNPVQEKYDESGTSNQVEKKSCMSNDSSNIGSSKSCEQKHAVTSAVHNGTVVVGLINSDERTERQTRSSNSVHNNEDIRPHRPDTLDLRSGGGSRPSSRQRRRRKRQEIVQPNSSLPQQQQQQQQQNLDNMHRSHQSCTIKQQHHIHHRQPRRDRDGLHHFRDHNYSKQDLPGTHSEHNQVADGTKSRVVHDTSRSGAGRCDHRRPRRHHRSHQENTEHRSSETNTDIKGKQVNTKINYPSVEVARLRKLEMTYAEVLKNSMNRCFNKRY